MFTLTTADGSAENFSGSLSLDGLMPPQLAANTNNYAPTGISTASLVSLFATSPVNLTGLMPNGTPNRVLHVFIRPGSSAITLTANDAGSDAANRFSFSSSIVAAAGTLLTMLYDTESSRWYLLSSNSPSGGGSSVASVMKSADTSRSNTQVPASDPELTLALSAGNYLFTAFLSWTTSTTQNVRANMNASTGLTLGRYNTFEILAANGFVSAATENLTFNPGTDHTPSIPSNGPVGSTLTGFLILSAPATVAFQWAQGTSSATAIVLKQGSWLRFEKVG